MDSDAAYVGYGGPLGRATDAASPGSWSEQVFWTAVDWQKSITWRELRAVRLLLNGSFVHYVCDPSVRRMLVHDDNQAALSILNAMVSVSKTMMA